MCMSEKEIERKKERKSLFYGIKTPGCSLNKYAALIMQQDREWCKNIMEGVVQTFNPESMFVINDSTVSGGFALSFTARVADE